MKCDRRLAAISAYNNGLQLQIPEKNNQTCPCDYVINDKQWEIIFDAYEQFSPADLPTLKLIRDSCLNDVEGICPGGGHQQLKSVDIVGKKK